MGMNALRKKFFETTNTVTNTTLNGESMDVTSYLGFSIQVACTGTTIAGSGKLQASLDGVSWTDIGSTSQTISGDTVLFWNIPEIFISQVRPVVTSSNANTITLVGYGVAKGGS